MWTRLGTLLRRTKESTPPTRSTEPPQAAYPPAIPSTCKISPEMQTLERNLYQALADYLLSQTITKQSSGPLQHCQGTLASVESTVERVVKAASMISSVLKCLET